MVLEELVSVEIPVSQVEFKGPHITKYVAGNFVIHDPHEADQQVPASYAAAILKQVAQRDKELNLQIQEGKYEEILSIIGEDQLQIELSLAPNKDNPDLLQQILARKVYAHLEPNARTDFFPRINDEKNKGFIRGTAYHLIYNTAQELGVKIDFINIQKETQGRLGHILSYVQRTIMSPSWMGKAANRITSTINLERVVTEKLPLAQQIEPNEEIQFFRYRIKPNSQYKTEVQIAFGHQGYLDIEEQSLGFTQSVVANSLSIAQEDESLQGRIIKLLGNADSIQKDDYHYFAVAFPKRSTWQKFLTGAKTVFKGITGVLTSEKEIRAFYQEVKEDQEELNFKISCAREHIKTEAKRFKILQELGQEKAYEQALQELKEVQDDLEHYLTAIGEVPQIEIEPKWKSIGKQILGYGSVREMHKRYEKIHQQKEKIESLTQTLRAQKDKLIDFVANKYASLQEYEEKEVFFNNILTLLDKKDRFKGHSTRVGDLNALGAFALILQDYKEIEGYDKFSVDTAKKAGDSHDFGKLFVQEDILAAGRLSKIQFAQIMNHSEDGERFLKTAGFEEVYVRVARNHHKPYDKEGRGYPYDKNSLGELSHTIYGKSLCLYTRMTKINDVIDAKIGIGRENYTSGASLEDCYETMHKESDLNQVEARDFDPELVENMFNVVYHSGAYKKYYSMQKDLLAGKIGEAEYNKVMVECFQDIEKYVIANKLNHTNNHPIINTPMEHSFTSLQEYRAVTSYTELPAISRITLPEVRTINGSKPT